MVVLHSNDLQVVPYGGGFDVFTFQGKLIGHCGFYMLTFQGKVMVLVVGLRTLADIMVGCVLSLTSCVDLSALAVVVFFAGRWSRSALAVGCMS